MKQTDNMNDEMKTKKSVNPWKITAIVFSSLAAVLVLAALIVGLLFWYSSSPRGGMFSSRDSAVPLPTDAVKQEVPIDADWIDEEGNAYNYRDDVISILLMGVDYMADAKEFWDEDMVSNGGNADVLALVVLNTKTFDFDILYIPRDTITDVIVMDADGNYIDTIRSNICTSHSYGDGEKLSCQLTADAVSRLLMGAPVNRYAALNDDAILALNELVGGVKITFDFDCTELDPSFYEGNTVRLNNLYFKILVTYRDLNVTDSAYTRGMRIMNILKALFDQLKDKIVENPAVALEIFSSFSEHITTNLDLSEITFLARNIGKMDFSMDSVIRLQGETILGEKYAEFHADPEWIHDFVVEHFCVPVQ